MLKSGVVPISTNKRVKCDARTSRALLGRNSFRSNSDETTGNFNIYNDYYNLSFRVWYPGSSWTYRNSRALVGTTQESQISPLERVKRGRLPVFPEFHPFLNMERPACNLRSGLSCFCLVVDALSQEVKS